MPATIVHSERHDVFKFQTKASIPSGEMSGPIYLNGPNGASITAAPGSGCTMRVFKSTSLRDDIKADILNGSLSYANLIAGTQPTNSVWMLWKPAAVTAITNEGPIENDGDAAVIATCTGGAGILEVAR